MRRFALGVAALVLVAGCGGEGDESTTTTSTTEHVERSDVTSTAIADPDTIERATNRADAAEAHDELRSLAAEAAQLLDGINITPSEHGAAITFNEGVVDRDHFCETDAVAYDTDTLLQAEKAWAEGWTSEGGDRTDGVALYNAMSIDCLK